MNPKDSRKRICFGYGKADKITIEKNNPLML